MSDLVERVENAAVQWWSCGFIIDGVWVLCCDDRAKDFISYRTPENCDCRNSARYLMAIVLEEAAKVAEAAGRQPVGAGDGNTYTIGTALDAAAAIRKMGEK